MAEERNNYQIARKDAKNCFVESLNDCFPIGRVHFAFATYDVNRPAGQRQTNNIHIYIAVDEFLELCRKLECVELKYMLQTKKKNGDSHRFISALVVQLQINWQNKDVPDRMARAFHVWPSSYRRIKEIFSLSLIAVPVRRMLRV